MKPFDKKVSFSSLNHVHRSVAHLIENIEHPPEQTGAMVFGTVFHMAILEPQKYDKLVVVMPNFDRRTKVGKAEYAAFQEMMKDNPDKIAISESDRDCIARMREAVDNEPEAKKWLTGGLTECWIDWVDGDYGFECVAKVDYLRPDAIIDLKSCRDASMPEFSREIGNKRYHVQGAMYIDGVYTAMKSEARDFIMIAVEKTPPYSVACYSLHPIDVDTGRKEYQADMAKLDEAMNSKYYGYWPSTRVIQIPRWRREHSS